MAKHLAQKEKPIKKPTRRPLQELTIRIPDRSKAKTSKRHTRSVEDRFQSAMLNKTLDRKFTLTDLVLAGLALVLLLVAYFLPTHGLIRLLSFLVPFLLAGYSYLFEAFQEAFMGIVLGRELIITLASLMAFCGGSNFGGAAIMVFMKLCDLALSYAELLQSQKIDALYALRSDKATIISNSGEVSGKASELQEGDLIEIAAGELIPVDGVVIGGTSVLDASALTRSNSSFAVSAGSRVLSGCTNVSAPIRVKVECPQSESLISSLIRSAENAWMHKSAQQRLLQRIMSYAAAGIVAAAIVLALVFSVVTGQWRLWLLRASVLLTVSQMYAVVQTVKLAYDCAASNAAGKGLIIKGHDVLEALSRAETMVFDKTGTVTVGKYTIKGVFPRGITEDQLLFLAGAAELHSDHPIAKALVNASGAYASDVEAVDIEETPGRGVCAFIDGRSVYVGNGALMEDHGISYDTPTVPGSAIHVAIDNRYVGHIVMEDALRDGAFDAVEELRLCGVSTTVMLTGDVHSAARKVASSLNFDLVRSELTPEEKCSSVEYLMSNRNVNTTLAFVGDGICDTDALKLATVGIALGCLDRKEAIAASDVAILGEDIHNIPRACRIAKAASEAATTNMIVCGAVKVLVLLLGLFGVMGVGLAVTLQTAALLFEVLNALRILYFEENRPKLRREKIQ